MIHHLDETLKDLLVRYGRLDPEQVDIKFEMPSPEWSRDISKPTVNLYLYDVRENLELRSNELHVTRNLDSEVKTGTQQRAPVRVDLSYMISVWTRQQHIADEHELLGQILKTLLSHPVLPDDVLIGEMRNQPLPLRAWIAQPERTPSAWDFWGHVEHRMKSGLSYVVTAAVQPYPVANVRLVETRDLRQRQASPDEIRSINRQLKEQ